MSGAGEVILLQPGSIVQIGPSFPNPALIGCLAIVEECHPWGVKADAVGPGTRRARRYPVRLVWADLIGTCGSLKPGEDPTAGDGHNPGPAVCQCASPRLVDRKFHEEGAMIFCAKVCQQCEGYSSQAVASWVADVMRGAYRHGKA